METKTKVKKWGNSLGIIIPRNIVNKEGIRAEDEVSIDIIKKNDLMKLFGTLKFKKTTQQMKEEDRDAWGE